MSTPALVAQPPAQASISTGAVPAGTVGPVESGFSTSEFATSATVVLLAVATMVLHKDFSSQVQIIAPAVTTIVTAVYTIGRSLRKAGADKAAATVLAARIVAAGPAVSVVGPAAPRSGNVQAMLPRRFDLAD